jgi:hypothetical protein
MSSRRKARVRGVSETLEDGQDEGGSLAGAGLGCGEDVAAGEDEGDGRALHGRRLCVALSRNGGEKVGR